MNKSEKQKRIEVRARIKEKGFHFKDVAKAAGINRVTLYRWLIGQNSIRLETYLKIAKLLEIDE